MKYAAGLGSVMRNMCVGGRRFLPFTFHQFACGLSGALTNADGGFLHPKFIVSNVCALCVEPIAVCFPYIYCTRTILYAVVGFWDLSVCGESMMRAVRGHTHHIPSVTHTRSIMHHTHAHILCWIVNKGK